MDLDGTVAFGISGALAAGRKRMDFVGVVVLGSIVAVGGGTTRDLILGDAPVFWIGNPTFLLVGAIAALAVIPLSATRALNVLEEYRLLQLFDAAGMALFVVTGTNVALAAGADAIAAAVVGVISGVGGGIIRDVLANQTPSILTGGQFYASAALVGSLLYVLFLEWGASRLLVFWVPIVVIFGLRAGSLFYGWGFATFDLGGPGHEESDPPAGTAEQS